MNRTDAYNLVLNRLGNGPTFAHCLSCEACMRALARHFGENEDLWGLTGLVHDLDLDECADDLDRHAIVAAEVLKTENAPEIVIHAVLAHNEKTKIESLLDKALWVVDPTTGMITASALIRPSKSTNDLTVKSIQKRMKDKRFAAAINREQILSCQDLLGIPISDFLSICLKAMDEIRFEIGLS